MLDIDQLIFLYISLCTTETPPQLIISFLKDETLPNLMKLDFTELPLTDTLDH
jgi:hypothetical protein